MSTDLLSLLKNARKLPIDERRQLTDLLIDDLLTTLNSTSDEQTEEAKLKKKKLYLKDEMDRMLRRHRQQVHRNDKEIQAARAIVAETSGSMAGLDRATLIHLAEDEEFSGY